MDCVVLTHIVMVLSHEYSVSSSSSSYYSVLFMVAGVIGDGRILSNNQTVPVFWIF